MNNPKFSVIIPVYNGAATLERALDSVLSQSYPAHEIIVVDDGSTDRTSIIASAYVDQVHYVYQPNAGVSAARNFGAQIAGGDWLAFLDADDWFYPERLRLHAEWIAEDQTLDFLTGDQEYRRPDKTLIRNSMSSTVAGRRLLERAGGKNRIMMSQNDLADFVEDHFGDTPTLSLPRQTFLDLGGYPTSFRVCEDVNLLIRLIARSHRIGVVCQPLAVYCVHEDSACRRDPIDAQRQTVKALLPLRDELRNAPPSLREGLDRGIYRARRDLATALLRHGEHMKAVRAVLPSFFERPSWKTLHEVLSIARGLKQGDRQND
jgi:glycosyltransferase involved in cell wall biosynthesis